MCAPAGWRMACPSEVSWNTWTVARCRMPSAAVAKCREAPRLRIATLNDVQPSQAEIIGRLHVAAANYARQQGFADDGYRVVMNCNDHAGQTVFQIHLHLLAGAPLGRFGTPK